MSAAAGPLTSRRDIVAAAVTVAAAAAGTTGDGGSYFPNKQSLPASTLVQVPRLANPAFLLEIEAIAILPPKA
jgi:enamine deaminase RidA (YjgF/YER057c/UK114 family)